MSVAHTRKPTEAPGPRGALLLGSLGELRSDPLGFLLGLARQYGPVAHFNMGRFDVHLIADAAGVKHVLQDNNENYGRQTNSHQALRATMGNGLVTSDGDFWRRQRRISQPAFHKQRLQGFGAIMSDGAAALVERWRAHAGGPSVDVVADLSRLTLQVLGRCLFDLDLDGEAHAVGQALVVVLHHTMDVVHSLFPIPRAIPTPANLRFNAAVRELDRVVQEMIDERRQSPARHNDLLGLLLAARDEETGEGMTDRQLRDEVLTLTLAGHETTAMALSWTLALLSLHPVVRRQLEQEVAQVLGGRPARLEDLPRLTYTRQVLDESMRLYPPAWIVPRSAIADDEIGGFRIPGGSFVLVSPYVTHRDPALWPNPEGFDPDRFAPGADAGRPRYAHFPFGGGPHLCIGAGFALMEAQLVLATVVQALRLDLAPGATLAPEPLVTLRPRGDVPMLVSVR